MMRYFTLEENFANFKKMKEEYFQDHHPVLFILSEQIFLVHIISLQIKITYFKDE